MTDRDSTPLRLVAYLRVSTTEQVDGYGLDIQRAAITRWAERCGHAVVDWCVDEGVSGTKGVEDREGLACALAALDAGDADGLVVHKLDRLARELTIQEGVLATVWRGGRAFQVDGGEILPDDPDDPMRTAIRQVMGVFAQLEASTIRKRLRDGRRAKASAGGYAGGAVRYGWTVEDGEVVEDPEAQQVLAEVHTWREEGASLRTIADRLNDRGVATSRGGRWHASSVRRLLDDQVREAERDRARRERIRQGAAPLFTD